MDQVGDGDGEKGDLVLGGMICEGDPDQLHGDLRQGQGGGDGSGQRDRTGDGAHPGEAHPDRDGAPGPIGRSQPAGDPISEVGECGSHQPGGDRSRSEGGLRADRAGPAVGLDPAGICVLGQGRKLGPGGPAEQVLDAGAAGCGQVADGVDAGGGKPGVGHRTDTPHQPDGQRSEEGPLAPGLDDDQAIGLGHLGGDLG